MKGYIDEEASFFGKVPYFPNEDGNEYDDHDKFPVTNSGYCATIAVQTEWFIAYARRNILTKADIARANRLKKALISTNRCKKNCDSPNDDESYIDGAHRDHLITVLDDIIKSTTKSSTCHY